MHNTASLPAARLAGGPLAHVIDADDIAIRLIVQSHRQSGLSTVYTDLLDFEGHEFYIRPEPSLTGTTYARPWTPTTWASRSASGTPTARCR
ncbi:CASTOR/POLLUX-related putative ion channel [Actinomadura soli]|uniref:CASTOR/POLLUX-related putative ion channel n=1 Tax=Actinomadura soli TaxID=2508997 RepID=UPI001E5D25E0|nr:hypothetical protein [Actinomadura soli]